MNRSSLSITLPSLVSKHVCFSTFIARNIHSYTQIILNVVDNDDSIDAVDDDDSITSQSARQLLRGCRCLG